MPQHLEWSKYHSTLTDGGPLYTETDFSHWLVEPWNAITSLAFLVPAVYWLWKIRLNFREYPILCLAGLLLFTGGTGSTLFHAFRSSRALIVMDFLPMALATFTVSAYMWYRVLFNKWYYVVAIMAPILVLRQYLFDWLNHHNAINVSYFLSGVMIFLPMLLWLVETKWKQYSDALWAVSFFSISLFFRQIDAWEPPLTPIGTHFLWHLFGAWGSFYLARYLYGIEKGVEG